ncbi:MAG: spore cortex biosynthesis protein YabQ [Lachnospiraceae bacterium]
MGGVISQENLFLLHMIGLGAYITFVYDLFRILRRVFVHNGFFISLEDGIFWIFTTITVFVVLQTEGNGTLRWFAVLGAFVGMFIYKKTVSPFFVKCISKLINWLLSLIKKCLKPFCKAGIKAKKKLTHTAKLLKITICKK